MDWNRRRFLGVGIGLGAVSGLTQELVAVEEPYTRAGEGNLLPGLAAYSFRQHFAWFRGRENRKVAEEKRLDMIDFVGLCASLGVAAELTSYFFPPDAEAGAFTACRREAHLAGTPVAGTAVGNQFTLPRGSDQAREQMAYLRKWIDRAVLLGAPHVRVFAGAIPKGVAEARAEQNAIEALREAGAYAADRGVFLGIENHDSIGSAERLLHVVTSVDNPWVGVNLDSGNFRTEDPYRDFAECVPYAVNVQLKTHLLVGGEKVAADLDQVFGLLRAGGYSGYVVLEYEEKEDPFSRVPEILREVRRLCLG